MSGFISFFEINPRSSSLCFIALGLNLFSYWDIFHYNLLLEESTSDLDLDLYRADNCYATDGWRYLYLKKKNSKEIFFSFQKLGCLAMLNLWCTLCFNSYCFIPREVGGRFFSCILYFFSLWCLLCSVYTVWVS